MVYCSKDEILDMMKFFRRDFDLINISDRIQFLAMMDVNAYLSQAGIPLPVADLHSLLKAAELCFYMEHAGMVKQIENAFGIVKEETIGSFSKKYENGMPMFFFAQGSSLPFLELLPHETWRMRGYKYVRSFISAYWLSIRSSTRSIWGVVAQDNSGRGYGWKEPISDYDYTGETFNSEAF